MARKDKKVTGSKGKSSQRSSSVGSTKSSGKSRSSKSTKSEASSKASSKASKATLKPIPKSNSKSNSKKDLETYKTIYKSSEDIQERDEESFFITISIIKWFQLSIILYLLTASIYQYVWGNGGGDEWFSFLCISVIQIIPTVLLLLATYREHVGHCCLLLTAHFVLLFTLFSLFLQNSYTIENGIFNKLFGLSGTTFFAATMHFFVVIQSMVLIGDSKQRNDYSEKIIVEGVEKRRKDLYLMISDLISEICYDDKDVKVNLTIKDETGHLKSMRGAGVEAGVNRVLEMTTDGRGINLSTSNTSLARINVPKHKTHHRHHHKNHYLAEVEGSKYNKCSKQEKILSPRKILK